MKHKLCIGLMCVVAGTAWAQKADVALPEGATLLSEGHRFPEGPMVDKEGRLYFSDPRANTIHRYDGSKVETVAENTQGGNGLAMDPTGAIFMCQGPGAAISKLAADGSIVLYVDKVDGKDLNSPNDLVFDASGNLFFTNPGRGDVSNIVRVDKQGVAKVVATGPKYPNGIAIGPEGKWLYVCDTMGGSALWRFALTGNGQVGEGKVLVKFGRGGPDGLAVAASGNLFVAMNLGSKIVVTDPEGAVLKEIPFPRGSAVTNVCFGGADWKTLYVTLGGKGTVYALPVDEPGLRMVSHAE